MDCNASDYGFAQIKPAVRRGITTLTLASLTQTRGALFASLDWPALVRLCVSLLAHNSSIGFLWQVELTIDGTRINNAVLRSLPSSLRRFVI